MGSGGSNVCFSYFLLIDKKLTNFVFQPLKPFLRGWKGWGCLRPNFLLIPEGVERVVVQMFGKKLFFLFLMFQANLKEF